MEQSRTSNSSKVTVEYSDPSGIFSSVSNDLRKSFPLRNLHWNSSSRPLRFIDSLHVELIKDDQRISQSAPATIGPEEAVHIRTNGAKERRHQIPGLRRTPYLKIYLLRCNDIETYKTTSRELLRDWVRDQTPSYQSSSSVSKAENHDAFEWLIIHVLSSIDDVTTVSRVSGGSKIDSSAEKTSNTSRWPNRSSSTVIEKIRSDFNGTSKTAIDRVAQIQVGDNLEGSVASNQQPLDDIHGFKDLISKLKFLILASFDQRVSQYEEDIREKDSQRNLPGWNFNTFFVLKEGLARGFESVGLIEDALTSYHELSTNLDQIVAEIHTKSVGDHTNPFREFTEDLFHIFKWAIGTLTGDVENPNNSQQLQDLGGSLLNIERKPYRDLILENNISAFDFLCYVFARKMSLQLRLVNVRSSNQTFRHEPQNDSTQWIASRPMSKPEAPEAPEAENLLILTDICQQTLEFITSATPAIRMDLKISTQKLAQYLKKHNILESVCCDIVENIIASWTFSASQMMLEKTSVQNISVQMESLVRQFKLYNYSNEIFPDRVIGVPKLAPHENLSTRTSFLPPHNTVSVSSSDPEIFPSIISPNLIRQLPPNPTGLQSLAAQQANLYGLARRSLGSLGLRHGGWKGSWSEFGSSQSAEDMMVDVYLGDDLTDKSREFLTFTHKLGETTLLGLQDETLRSALVSKHAFYTIFEDLTASTLALFILGDRPKSAQAMAADVAAIRFYLEDYIAAASYFHQLAPFYSKEGWSLLEINMLDMYAQCLKHLNRADDYIRIGLRIVAKLACENATASRDRWRQDTMSFSLTELILASRQVDQAISVPMDSYFCGIVIDPYPRPYADHDGFQMKIHIHSLMQETLEAQQIQISLISVEDDHRSELCLTTNIIYFLKPGTTIVFVETNVTLPGWYTLDKMLIKSENIVFTRRFFPSRGGDAFFTALLDPASSESMDVADHFRVLVWPQYGAFDVHLSLCNVIHLERPRSLHVELFSGWNDIIQGKVFLRAGSAGLRLHTAEAIIASGNTTLLDASQPGDIVFGNISADTNIVLKIPYGLESDLKEITVKIEVSFTTLKGTFTCCSNPTIPILLPLGVNVQDIFQQDSLFSKFTISTANAIPLCVSKCQLQSSVDFDVASPPLGDEKFGVFARQPLSFISMICRKLRENPANWSDQAAQQGLLLQIEYRCLDQEISETIERSLMNSLAAADLLEISRLLIPNLLAKYRSKLSIQDFEMVGLLREIDISTILESIWATVASGVMPGCRNRATKWLTDYQKEYNRLSVLKDSDQNSKPQYLTVPVDIPQVGAVHRASIQLQSEIDTPSENGCAIIGQPIPAELVIKHTRQWFDQTKRRAKNETLEFYYDVQASLDTWLIGGQRKARFVAKENETLRFPLLLIPQKTGHLLYPSVDISTFCEISDSAGEPKTSIKASCVSETNYRNQSDTFLIVSDLSSTTISLDPGSSAAGSWLVDSRRGPIV